MVRQIRGPAGPTSREVGIIIESLEARGLNPMEVRSCLPQSGMQGHYKGLPAKGCNCFDVCPFGSARFGAFKGNGPKNVKVYIDPNDGHGRRQELPFTCFHVAMHLQSRMRAGIAALEKGLPGEIIDVVGGEPGVEIPGADSKYMHVCRTKVMVKVDPEDRSNNPRFKVEVQERPIEPFSYDEPEYDDTFEAQLGRQYEERKAIEQGGLTLPNLPQVPHSWDPNEDTDEPVDMDLADEAPVEVLAAEPVGKKK